MIDMQTGERRSVSIILKQDFIKPVILCCVEEVNTNTCKQFFNITRHTKKCNSSFVKNSHLNHRQIIIQWIKTIQFLACQFTTRMIPNPVIIVLCMLFKRCSLRYDLKWPSLTPVTSHNNHSLTDRHADDPGDDRDTLSILQNKHLSQKKIKHQQQCHPGHRSASGLTHPPSLSWSPLSVHTKTGIQ